MDNCDPQQQEQQKISQNADDSFDNDSNEEQECVNRQTLTLLKTLKPIKDEQDTNKILQHLQENAHNIEEDDDSSQEGEEEQQYKFKEDIQSIKTDFEDDYQQNAGLDDVKQQQQNNQDFGRISSQFYEDQLKKGVDVLIKLNETIKKQKTLDNKRKYERFSSTLNSDLRKDMNSIKKRMINSNVYSRQSVKSFEKQGQNELNEQFDQLDQQINDQDIDLNDRKTFSSLKTQIDQIKMKVSQLPKQQEQVINENIEYDNFNCNSQETIQSIDEENISSDDINDDIDELKINSNNKFDNYQQQNLLEQDDDQDLPPQRNSQFNNIQQKEKFEKLPETKQGSNLYDKMKIDEEIEDFDSQMFNSRISQGVIKQEQKQMNTSGLKYVDSDSQSRSNIKRQSLINNNKRRQMDINEMNKSEDDYIGNEFDSNIANPQNSTISKDMDRYSSDKKINSNNNILSQENLNNNQQKQQQPPQKQQSYQRLSMKAYEESIDSSIQSLNQLNFNSNNNQQQQQKQNFNKRSFNKQSNVSHENLDQKNNTKEIKNNSNKYKFQRQLDIQFQKSKNVTQEQILLEGYIMKKSKSMFRGYEKRWFVLTKDKLYYYDTNKKLKMRGCINFKIAECEINLGQKLKFEIEIPYHNKKFHLEALDRFDKNDWVDQLLEVTDQHKKQNKLKQTKQVQLKTMYYEKYDDQDSITEKEFIQIGETGDIILFQTDNFGARMQRKFTGSKFDHVGLVIKLDEEIWIYDASFGVGVGLMRWREFIDWNDLYSHVIIRRLIYDKKEDVKTEIMETVSKTLNKEYKLTVGKLLKRVSVGPDEFKDKKKKKDQKDEGYFCSELVAKAYKRIKLLPQKKSACQYWPVDFTEKKDLQLLDGAKLTNEISIILNRHMKNK